MGSALLTQLNVVIREHVLTPLGRHSSDIPKRYTGARDTTFARSARIGFLSVKDTYIHMETDLTELRAGIYSG